MQESSLKIKRLREYRNLTQQYIADKLDISQNAYSKIENGTTKIRLDRLEQIAKVLDVPVESIISGEKQVLNIENNTIDKFYAYIENLHEENKELLLKQIEYLQSQNELLLQTIKEFSRKS